MTLYYFTRDTNGKSNAAGAVVQTWPIFYTENIITMPPLNVADFSSITRNDGMKQTTYKGWPLYSYILDKAPGDTLGQGVEGIWWVIDPGKLAVAPTAPPPPPPADGNGGYSY